MDIWKRIQSRIRSQNTTQEWVAKVSRVPVRTFRGWINREIMPNADQAFAVAQALETTVEWLVSGEDGTKYLDRLYGYSYITGLVSENKSIYGPDPLIKDIARLSNQDREEIQALVNVKLMRASSQTRHA